MAYPNGIVPVSTAVYPTPLFESILSFIFLFILLKLRKKETNPGFLFFIYLIMNGCARFSIEFIRLNPSAAFGMTQAQLVALVFIAIGGAGLFKINRNSTQQTA
jgi:phosphatidylglycerol:prolipoprotein diacylglycerol transferase